MGLLCSTLTSHFLTVFISWICCFPKKERVNPRPAPFQGEKWVSAGTPDLQHTNVNTALQLCRVTQGASRAPEILHWEQIINCWSLSPSLPWTNTNMAFSSRLALLIKILSDGKLHGFPPALGKIQGFFSLYKYPLPQTHWAEHVARTRPHLLLFRQHTQSNNNSEIPYLICRIPSYYWGNKRKIASSLVSLILHT